MPESHPRKPLLLTEEEWDDLSHIAKIYTMALTFERETPLLGSEAREADLCQRIMEANQ